MFDTNLNIFNQNPSFVSNVFCRPSEDFHLEFVNNLAEDNHR